MVKKGGQDYNHANRSKGVTPPLAAFAVTHAGYALALRLKKRFTGLKVFSPARLKNGGIVNTVNAAFGDYSGLIFICASGIAVRAVAPNLKGKHLDPAVVVVDDQGKFAISLLSGHLGGANELARETASALDAAPVITTATDGAGLPCVEDIAKKFSLAFGDVKKIKCVNAAILNGGPVSIFDADAKRLSAMRRAYAGAGVFAFKSKPASGKEIRDIKDASAFVIVSNSAHTALPNGAEHRTLILRPREFAVGIGCRRFASAAQIRRVVKNAFDSAGLSMLCIRNIATIDIKADEKGLLNFARSLNVPIEYFTSSTLKTKKPPSGPSAFVAKAAGCPAVAEPAALLSAKAKKLWIKKQKSDKVTVAAARVSSRW
ncbi:MAG: cobalt-precorrin 5A hydrolase [Deltaproteobacteria bacterium]|nr:cobalt-precorrin 5A hydrolase [Deltaproteobacteria bacterium]